MNAQSTSPINWTESDSRTFINYGREQQIETIISLIPAGEESFGVLELCCGGEQLAIYRSFVSSFPAQGSCFANLTSLSYNFRDLS